MSIDFQTDQLIVLVYGKPVGAYFRGFVCKDRKTGRIFARWRFKTPNGETHWYQLEPQKQTDDEETIKKLVFALSSMVILAASRMFNQKIDVACHYPPDQGRDMDATTAWLIEQDLIELKGIEPPHNKTYEA
jgi:hypothetical protein